MACFLKSFARTSRALEGFRGFGRRGSGFRVSRHTCFAQGLIHGALSRSGDSGYSNHLRAVYHAYLYLKRTLMFALFFYME